MAEGRAKEEGRASGPSADGRAARLRGEEAAATAPSSMVSSLRTAIETERAGAEGGQLTVVTYNILAKSLGSNCIPWMIEIDRALRDRLEAATGKAWNDWRLEVLQDGYKAHFHKNLASGDYMAMRAIWSAPRCASAGDLPESMHERIQFVREDVVAYKKGGQRVEATTLRGLLRAALAADLAQAVFDDIVGRDVNCFSWDARGPRLFRQLTGAWAELGGARADVLALQEYDVHKVKAAYRGDGVVETFNEAMAAAGYCCAFFHEPNMKRETPTGIAIYWRRDTCKVEADTPLVELACGDTPLADGAFNIDLQERYHAPKATDHVKAGDLVRMPDEDRRCVGLLRLTTHHGAPLWVCTTHLMTESRDNKKNCMYPGEVRAGELATIREAVAKYVGSAAVPFLLLGDFNSAPHSEVFTGQVGKEPIATGFRKDDGAFHWTTANGGDLVLRDAFADEHRGGAAVARRPPTSVAEADGLRCTSVNADRINWIDYVWYSGLTPGARSSTAVPATQLPSPEHPSDHLPLAVTFRLLT